MSLKHKTTAGAKLLKADSEAGTATVAFAQLEVVDHDGDYTLPGAFQAGQKVKLCQTGHAHGVLPSGVGEIVGEQEIDGKLWAVADLKFFLNTPQGRAEYETLKAIDDAGYTQEFSYGYDTLAQAPGEIDGQRVNLLQKQSVYEISPVLRGAGIGTTQLAVKAKPGEACPTCGEVKAIQTPDDAAGVVDDDAAAKLRDAEQAVLQSVVMQASLLGVPIPTE